jgi:hypothetical protein
MIKELENLKCRYCGESFRPNSRKNTHYCSPRCGDHSRSNKKREVRLGKLKNKAILDSYKIVRNHRITVTKMELESKGFNGELFDKIEYFPIANSTDQSSLVYYGYYIINNETGLIHITKF